jgi:plastocyanin
MSPLHRSGAVRSARPRRVLSAVIAAAAASSSSFAAGPASQEVDIAKFAFVPKEVTVAPGTRVRWTNHDETPHTVTHQAASKAFSSPGMDIEDYFEFVFTSEGDFEYFCTVHPMMTGVVHVRKAAAKAT